MCSIITSTQINPSCYCVDLMRRPVFINDSVFIGGYILELIQQ